MHANCLESCYKFKVFTPTACCFSLIKGTFLDGRDLTLPLAKSLREIFAEPMNLKRNCRIIYLVKIHLSLYSDVCQRRNLCSWGETTPLFEREAKLNNPSNFCIRKMLCNIRGLYTVFYDCMLMVSTSQFHFFSFATKQMINKLLITITDQP